jgi:hypothetical protein
VILYRSASWWSTITLSGALFALVGGSTADGEQKRVEGMGRTLGWVVAVGDELAFVDCQGRQSPLGGARVEPTSERCGASASPFTLSGVVRRIDHLRRIVSAEDDTGRIHAFHVPSDGPRLDDLNPGERIQATGPIDGQATGIARH